jgi:cyclic pyranopterin phosphate synthase
MAEFTHLKKSGEVKMVDVTVKEVTRRRAIASGKIKLTPAIVHAIKANTVVKGNVLETARIGAIQAAKRTFELIPLCHPIPISLISIDFELSGSNLLIRAEVAADAKTGVEMEALTAVSVAALVVYDMCKAIDKGMKIGPIELLQKQGGKSGDWRKTTETQSDGEEGK